MNRFTLLEIKNEKKKLFHFKMAAKTIFVTSPNIFIYANYNLKGKRHSQFHFFSHQKMRNWYLGNNKKKKKKKRVKIFTCFNRRCETRWFSNHVSRLLSRSHTFAIIVILDFKIHQSMWIHWPFFQKLEPKVIDP